MARALDERGLGPVSARPMSPATLRRLMRSKVAADAAPEERIALWTLRLLKAAGAL